jgi:cysteine desulfurase
MAIYLDYAATAPMPLVVREAYTGALGLVGNPSSIHSQGQDAKRALEEAREQVAASLGADRVEVTFTGGGTEAVNLGIKGLYWARLSPTRNKIIAPLGEHHATIEALEWLEQHEGAVVEWIPLDEVGRIDMAAYASALGPDVALVTLLMANNEIGTVQPVGEVVALAAAQGIPVHVDAIAAYGYLPIDVHALGAAALSVSAHKIGGPVGIGALVIARSTTIVPLMHGGSQQRGRSGTQDAAGAVAFGVAAQQPHADLTPLRDRLIAGVRTAVPEAILRGDPDLAPAPDPAPAPGLDPAPDPDAGAHPVPAATSTSAAPPTRTLTPTPGRLPGNAHFTFPGCEGDSLLFLLDAAGFSVSTGSACQAGVPEASHVLLALGLDEPTARGALRFTIGDGTTEADVDALVAALPEVVRRARAAGLAAG